MTATADPAPARVLIVDDEENIRFLLRTALRHFGFAVEVAGDGRSALSAVRANPPDLLLLDVMLPDVDGFEVCRRLRGEGNDTPVLFLTARDGAEEAVRGLTLGGDDYVTKPFSLEEVVARIQALLRAPDGGSPRRCCRSRICSWTTTPTWCAAPAGRSSCRRPSTTCSDSC